MKSFILVLSLTVFSAHAEMIITGGFGSDGASGTSIPVERSVKDAAAVYKALDVKPDSRDKKVFMLEDESQFECSKPYSGISRINAGCQITLRASQKGKLEKVNGLRANLTFSGKLATQIFRALPVDPNGAQRLGASVRKAANVSCMKVVAPKAEATCTITDTNAIQMDVKI